MTDDRLRRIDWPAATYTFLRRDGVVHLGRQNAKSGYVFTRCRKLPPYARVEVLANVEDDAELCALCWPGTVAQARRFIQASARSPFMPDFPGERGVDDLPPRPWPWELP